MTTPTTAAVPWTRYVGAWLGIGSSPGALVLGAQLVDRQGGALPLVWLVAGAVLMGTLLVLQGQLGLRPPRGQGATFVEASRSYLPPRARVAVGLLVTCGMVGWVGFGVGIGAESLGRVTGLSSWLCAVGLGVVALLLVSADVRRWNVVAVATTLITLLLAPLLLLSLDRVEAPVTTTSAGGGEGVVVLAACVGYVAVFMLRSPDFSAGLPRRRSLLICVAALVVPAIGLCLVGAAMRLSVGSAADASLAGLSDVRWAGLAAGDLLIVLAVLAPTVTSAFSGGLALQVFTGLAARRGMAVVALLGIALGVAGFHRELLPWLALLAGVAPPIAVPFWLETARRRRGRAARTIATWTWLPASIGGGVLVAGGVSFAPLAALAVAALVSVVWATASS
ncbi:MULTISPECIES: hypothetical protein [unclassified Geodermatophilus]|uniref:hypothetical protein n=1 Tax=unclassified Geodermatophilus TaxID=2637632 RepID=UPI003EEA4B32